MKLYVLLFIALTLMGCSSSMKKGFNRGALREQISNLPEREIEVSDNEIQEILKKRSQLPKDFKMAVYFKQPKESYSNDWRWTEKDKSEIMDSLNSIKKQGRKVSIFPLISAIAAESDLKSLRLAAARHGADALLIINGGGDIDRYVSNYAYTYLFLAPIFFVPGSKVEGLFMANATMWDVRNEFLYMSAESEGEYYDSYPAAFPESNREIMKKSKAKAILQLKKNLIAMAEGY